MSTYTTSEAALLDVVRLLDNGAAFDSNNSSRGGFRALNAKGADWACVLMQARASRMGDNLGQGRGTHGKRQQEHEIACTVFRKRKQDDDEDAYTALTTMTDALVALLDTYPRLNGAASVKRAEVITIGDVRYREGKPWIYQSVLVRVLTETAPVLVESPR